MTQAFRNSGSRWAEARYFYPLPDDGAVDRLKRVVGPRYVPPGTLASPAAAAEARAVAASSVLRPGLGPINPTTITVHLQPGFAPADVVSPYHPIRVADTGGNRRVTLAAGEVPADRDFELGWRSASAEPTVALFQQHWGDGDYVMASVTPPADLDHVPTPPREMMFVIDDSGSMGARSRAVALRGPRDAGALNAPAGRIGRSRRDGYRSSKGRATSRRCSASAKP